MTFLEGYFGLLGGRSNEFSNQYYETLLKVA